MKLHLIALALGAALAGAAPAMAAGEYAPLNEVARCAVAKDRAAIADAVRPLALTADPAAIPASALGAAASCAPNGLDGPSMLVRGAVAQAFYFADFREMGLDPRVQPAQFADLGWPPIGDNDPATDIGIALFKLGDCVARNDGDNVDNLLRAPYGSALANRMLGLSERYYSACLPKDAPALTLTKDSVHAAIAQGAYYAAVRYWRGKLSFVQQK